MTLEQIRQAQVEGKTVCWSNINYMVIGDFIIYHRHLPDENAIGLTWLDGKTLNGKGEDFSSSQPSHYPKSPHFRHIK